MGSKNRRKFVSWSRLKKSFVYASNGIVYTLKHEQNFRVHLTVGAVIFILAQVLRIPLEKQAILAVVIGGVLALELINTAIEHVVDLMIDTYDERAKIIKDTAAGAVFIFSATAVIVGILILLPYIIALFSR
ncbi:MULTISPECIES: diacylglycerol kinase family protein [Bacillaceae]|uniref:Diacylglycerol kinase family protein n=1 Tax=Evansella alkalicola TaxID=745819 RepID=A0ABS6JW93_9BACI|nr:MULTISPECIES: diacylglycerol kinase family protein [Bacillaceae]MBU9722497.1 diacylglycerol kinase family protein [Bacillus alkalicola]